MNDNEKDAILDLLKTVRIGIVVLAVIGGYMQKDVIVGMI